MPTYYRVWCRHGKLEIEIESTDKAYVDRKVAEFTASLPKAAVKATKGKSTKPKGLSKKSAPKKPKKGKKKRDAAAKKAPKKKVKKSATKKAAKKAPAKKAAKKVDLAAAIRGAKNFTDIKTNILGKSRQLPRVLVCLSFASEATAADVTAATKKLGSEIIPNNVAKVIRQQGKGLVSSNKSGAVTAYALTAKGKKHVDGLLKG